ncbi:MAG: Ig-like domain-containing protein [Terracidiphilus sp.]
MTTTISATFSTPMNPATVTASTFKVTGPGGAGRGRNRHLQRRNRDVYAGSCSGIRDRLRGHDNAPWPKR